MLRSSSAQRAAIAMAVLLAIILLPFLAFEDIFEDVAKQALAFGPAALGSSGAALLALDVLLPSPSSLIITGMGLALGPLRAFAFAWVGLTVGACAGYALGAWAGQAGISRWVGIDAQALVQRHAAWAVPAFRGVPVLAEATVILAGASQAPFLTFFLTCALSNAFVLAPYVLVFATAEAVGIAGELPFFLAFGASVAVGGIFWWLGRWVRPHRTLCDAEVRADACEQSSIRSPAIDAANSETNVRRSPIVIEQTADDDRAQPIQHPAARFQTRIRRGDHL